MGSDRVAGEGTLEGAHSYLVGILREIAEALQETVWKLGPIPLPEIPAGMDIAAYEGTGGFWRFLVVRWKQGSAEGVDGTATRADGLVVRLPPDVAARTLALILAQMEGA